MINYGYNIYSQFGEDGIIQYLINSLNLNNLQSCEVGMSELTFSNTFNLVNYYNWYGVFIEKDPNNIQTINKGLIINKEVFETGENSLDNILSSTKLKLNFDILSIDIDGKDYHIWKSLNEYKPNVVIIEINPFFNSETEYVNDGKLFGTSFKSMVDLAKNKDYSLVCMTGNLIFVRNEKLYKTDLEKYIYVDPKSLFLDDAFMVTKKQFSFKRYVKQIKLI